MGTHVLEAFLITFGLDPKGFEDGSRRVEDESRKLRENQKQLYDEIEDSGRKVGETIKGLSREVVGLGMAFLGAKSITGFLTDIATGAASADRFGQIIGMSTERVYAWRRAVSEIDPSGGSAAADTSLQAIQNVKMGLVTGRPDAQALSTFARLGIGAGDLRNGDAGSILSKLAGAKSGMDPQLYANLLQQIGLPASTISLLMQGKSSVDKLIEKYEADTEGLKKAAEEQKKLQTAIVELQSAISESLVPVLSNDILPALKTIADWIKTAAGGQETPQTAEEWGQRIVSDLFTGKRNAWENLYEYLGPEKGAWIPDSWKKGGDNSRLHAITMHTESGGNPNAVSVKGARGLMQVMPGTSRDPGFGIRPSNGTKADDVRVGREYFDAMMNRYGNDPAKAWAAYNAGPKRLDDALKGGGNWLARMPAETRAYVAKNMALLRGGNVSPDLMRMQQSAGRRAGGFGFQTVTVNGVTIHTKATDAEGIARDFHRALNKRSAMVNADRVVNP